MAPRRKRKNRSKTHKPQPKKQGLFNPVKGDYASLTKPNTREEKALITQRPDSEQDHDEERYFLETLSDVKPLPGKKTIFTREPDPNIKPAHAAGSDELEALAHLSDLVSGNAEIDITFTDEFIEGAVVGFSRKLMHQLKKGEFPVQDHVDLHGLTSDMAEMRVREFLLQSYRRRMRCVLIVHGRGLNSENQIPILKERLPAWLKRGPINKIVLAFSTARPYDGGAGAVYVLLKKFKAGTIQPSGHSNK